jgi:cyanophycinase-like exopeptidase
MTNTRKSRAPVSGAILGLIVGLSGMSAPRAEETVAYQYYVVGNPENVERSTEGLIVMQGGGDDVDENYTRMGAKGGGGDFVVLRASGAAEYNDYIFNLCSCDSVETIVFENREAANDAFVVDKIRNAEALFIAGGDQSNYVRYWRGTPVEDAIHHVASKPAPIGGTSAGMAILGEFSYSAMDVEEGLTAESGLGDPFNADLTLARDFLLLPKLGNIITDQHLQERDRIGRTVAFLARLLNDGWTAKGRAIAADRETAVHIDPATGIAQVFATAGRETPFVYFMQTSGKPEVCVAGEPLTFRNIEVYRIDSSGSFDIDRWQGEGGISYTLGAVNGKLVSSRDSIY